MRNLFNTKLKIIVILAVLVTATLSVMAGLTNRRACWPPSGRRVPP